MRKVILRIDALAAMYEVVAYADQLLDALLDKKPKANVVRKLTVAVDNAIGHSVLDSDKEDDYNDELICLGTALRTGCWNHVELEDEGIGLIVYENDKAAKDQ